MFSQVLGLTIVLNQLWSRF